MKLNLLVLVMKLFLF